MSENANRPQAGTKKIHSKNEFELCYLRHQYLRKASTNPTAEEMKPLKAIAAHMARNTYYTYKTLFGIVGFNVEDLVSIANIHMVSFLGLFSLEKMPQKYAEFIKYYAENKLGKPTQEQLMNKDKANFTLFLKQRMEDVVRVCRQKARNIKGLPTEEFFFYCGYKKPPKILRNLVGNHESLGYKKIDQAVYKSIRKRVRVENNTVFRLNNVYYVAVLVDKKSLNIQDFVGADLDPYDNVHNMNPEAVFFAIEDDIRFEEKIEEFHSKTKRSKAQMIRKFIEENSKNPQYRDELVTARKMLKSLD